MDGVTLINCKLVNTDLAFEYSSVNAEITSKVTSIKNPKEGRIVAKAIDEVIMEAERVDTSATDIIITEEEND